jgi:hypothetical protein
MTERQTFTDRVAQLFRDMPGQWIDARTLAQVGGFAAWRTRTSECRRMGMDIRNRQRVEDTPLGSFKVTEYCYFPDSKPVSSLADAEDQPLPWEAA